MRFPRGVRYLKTRELGFGFGSPVFGPDAAEWRINKRHKGEDTEETQRKTQGASRDSGHMALPGFVHF
jgi:hypothetical protein